MTTRMTAALLALTLAVVLTACGGSPGPTGADDSPVPSADGPATGLRLANGLYDQEDGMVLAIGTLEWVDLEGGFYAITGSPEGGGTIAVIANSAEFAGELRPLVGKTVSATGTRSEGVSIRMAGPEIVITSVEEVTDTPGAAE